MSLELVVVSLDSCRRLSGLRLVTWTPLLVIFSLARSGYTCRGTRHEPSDHAGERLGVRGEATRDDEAIRKVASSLSFSLGFV